MAAPSQTSPNQASKPDSDHALDDGSVKAPPCPPEEYSKNNVQSPLPQTTQTTPTYESTEASESYLLAKSLMQAGDFDSALETIGMAMGEITSQLAARNDVDEDDAAIHPALAPLYYLYGTTLLYTIEESSDTLQAPDPQTNTDDYNGDDEDADNNGADDTQIAWENLETARMIIATKMIHMTDLADNDNGNDNSSMNDKLKLDLAQIHLRLGDLQRANGRYQDAVADYLSCLSLRLPILGPYDRKVADTQYNLGLVFMLLAAEGDRQQPQQQQQQQQQYQLHDPENDQTMAISPELREEYRAKALVHYLGAAKAFAGQIAFLTGRNPDEIVNISVTELSGKTTGMDQKELNATAMSATLAAIRTRVAQHLVSVEGVEIVDDSDQNMETIQELKEILDEIQETMDEAESAKMAIEQVSELKLKAQAAAEGDGGEVINMDGSTTTIGFGTSNASVAATAVLSTTTPVVAAGGAQPMMVVRKKTKRIDEDSKVPATATDQILKKSKSNDL
jgi:hypothetical protein